MGSFFNVRTLIDASLCDPPLAPALVRDSVSFFDPRPAAMVDAKRQEQALEDKEPPASVLTRPIMQYHPGALVFDQRGMTLRKENLFSPFNAWQTAYFDAAQGRKFYGSQPYSPNLQYMNQYAAVLDFSSPSNHDALMGGAQSLFNNATGFPHRMWFVDHGEWYGWVRPRDGSAAWFPGLSVDHARAIAKAIIAKLGSLMPVCLNVNPWEMQFFPGESTLDGGMRAWLNWLNNQKSIVALAWEYPPFEPRFTIAAEEWVGTNGKKLFLWTHDLAWRDWASGASRVFVVV